MEASCTVGGSVSWYNHHGDKYGDTLEIYTQNYHMIQQSHSWAHIWTKLSLKKTHAPHMFIVALFTITKTWKQPKCSSTDDWIRKMWCIYTMEYYSAIKKNEIRPFSATWIELVTHTEWSKSERERQIPYDITYLWNLIYGTNELFHRKENHGLGE